MMKKKLYLLILIIGLSSCNILARTKPIGEVSFVINEEGLIVIELKINNERVSRFIVDTGASVTVLDDDIATQLNLDIREEQSESTGASGSTSDRRKTGKQQISISEKVVLEEIELYVRDLSDLGEVNGIIGFDLFQEFVSQIDFDNNKITFYKRKGRPDTEGYQAVNFVESYCTPEVEVSFTLENGETFEGKALFDTGNTGFPLIINTPYKKAKNLPSKFQTLITSEAKGIHSKSQVDKGASNH